LLFGGPAGCAKKSKKTKTFLRRVLAKSRWGEPKNHFFEKMFFPKIQPLSPRPFHPEWKGLRPSRFLFFGPVVLLPPFGMLSSPPPKIGSNAPQNAPNLWGAPSRVFFFFCNTPLPLFTAPKPTGGGHPTLVFFFCCFPPPRKLTNISRPLGETGKNFLFPKGPPWPNHLQSAPQSNLFFPKIKPPAGVAQSEKRPGPRDKTRLGAPPLKHMPPGPGGRPRAPPPFFFWLPPWVWEGFLFHRICGFFVPFTAPRFPPPGFHEGPVFFFKQTVPHRGAPQLADNRKFLRARGPPRWAPPLGPPPFPGPGPPPRVFFFSAPPTVKKKNWPRVDFTTVVRPPPVGKGGGFFFSDPQAPPAGAPFFGKLIRNRKKQCPLRPPRPPPGMAATTGAVVGPVFFGPAGLVPAGPPFSPEGVIL